MLLQIEDLLKRKDVEYKLGQSLRALSTIKIGGKAEIAVFPKSESELIYVIDMLEALGKPYRILGRMSNVLPPDEDLSLALVRTDRISEIRFDGLQATASAGVSLAGLCARCADASLSGLEELSGIPGSLGGALFGNAGAYGREISELVESVSVYIPEERRTARLLREEIEFSYRKSSLSRSGFVILSAQLGLCSSDAAVIKEKISEYREKRRASAPCEPSLGSVFKRPEFGYASKMIDECGLRGYRIGGAEISRVHAGYIVNVGGALSDDVKSLVSLAEKSVTKKFGVRLEREIVYL